MIQINGATQYFGRKSGQSADISGNLIELLTSKAFVRSRLCPSQKPLKIIFFLRRLLGRTENTAPVLTLITQFGPIPEQGKWLKQVVTGYFNYHAVPTNGPTLTPFYFHVTNLWQRALRQRSQKDWTTRERIARLANDWLPRPRILHPWPNVRFAVRHPRWEPYARIGPVRICAGGAR